LRHAHGISLWLITNALVIFAHQGIRYRERARLKQAQLYGGLRKVALKCGDYLTRANVLPDRDAVFALEFSELASIMGGSMHLPATLSEIVRIRRAALGQRPFANSSERIQWSNYEWLSDAKILNQKQSTDSGDNAVGSLRFKGVAASGGVVAAPASVVLGLDGIQGVKPGSILVTRFTDPGWSPIFPLLKGLVLERGGVLCHGAIIAREFGIPTVTEIAHATDRITNGQMLEVNGDDGTVQCL
jgi:phosphohistidine swiveling domain-containing protein